MCDQCKSWGGKQWHRYGDGPGSYYERTDKSQKPKRTLRLHREVWSAVFGAIPEKHDIHHVDHDRTNNAIENLECLPKGAHRRHHTLAQPIARKDWAQQEPQLLLCVDCDAELWRKRVTRHPLCASCHSQRAEAKRRVAKHCRQCDAPFVSRAGTFCSQRCVNLATRGGTVRILPEGRG